MRVALLSRAAHPLHAPGGLERAVYHLAKHLRELGVDVLLLTRPGTGAGDFPGEVVTLPYGDARRGGAHGGVLDRTLHYPRFALALGRRVAEEVRAGRVEVVHAQGLTALGYGRLRRRDPALAAPLVMNPQGMEEHKTRGLKRLALARLRALSREAARLADRVVATDQATRDEVPRLLGVDPTRVVVLPNGIDPEEIARATPSDPRAVVAAALPALERAHPLLLSVGRLEGYKGFGDILAALARLQAEAALGPAWTWVVAGEGPERERLAGAARRSGIADRVHLAGRVPDALLHALYASADLFVHATRDEGSSLVTLEAMAHAKAVVATRAGGIPDKVVDGETGRLVPPGDPQALAGAIRALSADPELRQKLGARGRARALEGFSWPRIAERTLALYRELLEGGGR